MTHSRTALLVLTLLLAACGGTTTPPTPAPTPPTTPAPITPTPIPAPAPAPTPNPNTPISEVPYYGRWIVTYTSDVGTSFIHELNISTRSVAPNLNNGGFGDQTLCLDDEDSTPCDDDRFANGTGFIGELELPNGTAPLTLAVFDDVTGSSKLKLLTLGGATLGRDPQGRQTLQGAANWYFTTSDTVAEGTLTAVNVGTPRDLDATGLSPETSTSLSERVRSARAHRR